MANTHIRTTRRPWTIPSTRASRLAEAVQRRTVSWRLINFGAPQAELLDVSLEAGPPYTRFTRVLNTLHLLGLLRRVVIHWAFTSNVAGLLRIVRRVVSEHQVNALIKPISCDQNPCPEVAWVNQLTTQYITRGRRSYLEQAAGWDIVCLGSLI